MAVVKRARAPRPRWAAGLWVATALMLTGGCASPVMTDEGTFALHVEVDVFSGRVNPEFDLGGAEAEEVIGTLSDDVSTGTLATPPSILSFRGFILTGDSLPGGDSIRSIRVVPEGYYLESMTGPTSFVEDPAPYEVLLPIVEDRLGETSFDPLPPSDEG